MSHTPGPWVNHGDFAVRDPQSYSVATLNHLRDGPLIAAAPELLEALREAVPFLVAEADHAGITGRCCAAIAKAEGK